ncbi:hypothetical protein KOR34_45340 [Posidoniimonas corsicana]|uniref:Uncharacterized protein n=2 Tax=Posidoniimonas corsicana TaxID=1938618 RepID=A0A5C5UYB2_9BACT|nr:hypothetical protein KOR34_45340 [Posidoniimonas corsicana]
MGAKASDGRSTVDAEALQQLVRLGNAGGVKALFGRPLPFVDKLGSYLGRWRNFRLAPDYQAVWADLKLSDIAFGGKKDLGGYVLAIAQEDADALGADHDANQDGSETLGRMRYRIKSLRSIFLCDDPFLTVGGLFGDVYQPTTRPMLAANSTHAKGNAMSPRNLTSTRQPGSGLALMLNHYSDSPAVRIPLDGLGLSIDEFGAVNSPLFKRLAHEYASSAEKLRQPGTSLSQYIKGGWADECNEPLPPAAKFAADKLQGFFGSVSDGRTVLGWPA